MTRPPTPPRPHPSGTDRIGQDPAGERRRRGARLSVLVPVLLAGGAMVTVGAAAYARSVAGGSEAEHAASGRTLGVSVQAERLTERLTRSDEENRAHSRQALPRLTDTPAGSDQGAERDSTAEEGTAAVTDQADGAAEGPETEVFSGLDVQIGDLQVDQDPTGVAASSLPVTVTNTGDVTRSFDVTIVAVDESGEEFTSDVGTAANLRPGQTAEVRVLEIVNPEMVDRLATSTFEVGDVFAY